MGQELPNARITFDKLHVVWHANAAVDMMRRIEQRTDKSLEGMRWSLLKDPSKLKPEAAADLDALIAKMTTVRTARAWLYKERLEPEIQGQLTKSLLAGNLGQRQQQVQGGQQPGLQVHAPQDQHAANSRSNRAFDTTPRHWTPPTGRELRRSSQSSSSVRSLITRQHIGASLGVVYSIARASHGGRSAAIPVQQPADL